MSSFALETKQSLTEINVKGLCCKKAQLFGMLFYGGRFGIDKIEFYSESESVISMFEKLLLECYGGVCDIEYKNSGMLLTVSDTQTIKTLTQDKRKEKCGSCEISYLRGIFLACGTINDPENSYRMDFHFKRSSSELEEILDNFSIPYKKTVRQGQNVIYIKESEVILDFLNTVGATASAFAIMNTKIEKEFKGNANRAKNCDTANIKKSLDATAKQIKAIKKIINENRFDMLPQSLRITAKLRLENPEMPLQLLAELHEPRISKSGLNHRLEKIVEFSNG